VETLLLAMRGLASAEEGGGCGGAVNRFASGVVTEEFGILLPFLKYKFN
jgi:hypothetical protein